MTRKKTELERLCRCCEEAQPLRDPDKMLCGRKGIVSAGYCCRFFRYDPLKRDPGPLLRAAPLDFIPLEEESDRR